MDLHSYKEFYDKIGRLNGWDFSKLNVRTEGAAWDFYEEVAGKCKPSDLLLDIGTGGGEKLLQIADAALLAVGVDLSSSMVDTAKTNLERLGKRHVRFMQMDAGRLEFPAHFFNVACARHCGFDAKETARVLAEDGVFLTQQVSERDKWNMKQAFGRGQHGIAEPGTLLKQNVTALREAGFADIKSFVYDAAVYYESCEDLIFLLTHTPIVPGFGEDPDDFETLQTFVADNQTDQGIRTNEERFMIIATK
ncbi:class I SAM-dependent methyltransferase [Paenibacillus sp. MBLB4367]|uniref:class I SAM-dependent methyltransferase n=1 Tax=Paenibacillus sp. MBLB4367 TaxID=3384767 RepID=UPI003907EA75